MTLADLVRQTLSRTQTNYQGIFAVLHREHQQVSAMIAAIKATEDRDDAELERARVFSDIRVALLSHARAEQEVLYTRLQAEHATRAIALEAVQEHQVVSRLIGDLHALASRGEIWMAKFKVLAENIEHHVREEERDMFPKARRVLQPGEAAELLVAYEGARDRFATELAGSSEEESPVDQPSEKMAKKRSSTMGEA